jgi:S-adenosylmethionine hydrolase
MQFANSLITLTTDFGCDSPYVASMKAAIFAVHDEARVIDVTHSIPPQDIARGALVLAEVTPQFPPGTLHVAVIDPGVGTARAIVYAEIGRQRYVCPDNGLLSRLAAKNEPTRIRAVANPTYWHHPVSATFHGRDVMAPVAAHLSRGLAPEHLGPAQSDLVRIAWPEAHILPGNIVGEVESVDSFGNLVTNISAEQLAGVPTEETTRIVCGEHETFGIFRTYDDQPAMTLIALIGSSGKLELALVGDSAAAMLGEGVGSEVSIVW